MTAHPELRPLGPAQVIDVAVRLVRRHFKALATMLAVGWAPWAVLQPLVQFVTADDVIVIDGQPRFVYATTSAEARANLANFGFTLLALLAAGVVLVAMVRHIAAAYADRTLVDWRDALRFGVQRLGGMAWIFVLILVMVVATGLVLLFLGAAILGPLVLLVWVPLAVWLGVSWSVVIPVLVVEDERGVAALRRSFNLVRRRWWPTLGALIVAFIVLFAVQLGISLVLVGTLAIDSAALVLGLATVIGIVINFVVYPFWAAVQAVIYYDLRVRKEGLDLHLIAEGLRSEPPPSPPAPPAGHPPPPAPTGRPTAVSLPTPAPEGFVACPDCGRHRAADMAACPFCGSALGR